MTDIFDWPSLIHLEDHYVMVPLSEYQMANLVAALAQVPDTGDWWGELLNIVYVAMGVKGLETLQANNGMQFTREQISTGAIRG